MGGLGSGRYRGDRAVVEEFRHIDLAHLDRCGRFTSVTPMDGVTAISYVVAGKRLNATVPLRYSQTMFGGRRSWFACPGCSRGCRILYIVPQLRCRRCCRLLYQSQRVSPFQSRLWRADAIRERIGARLGQHFEEGEDFPPRPKRMRRTTYRRLEAKYEEAQARWLAGITSFIGRLSGRLGS